MRKTEKNSTARPVIVVVIVAKIRWSRLIGRIAWQEGEARKNLRIFIGTKREEKGREDKRTTVTWKAAGARFYREGNNGAAAAMARPGLKHRRMSVTDIYRRNIRGSLSTGRNDGYPLAEENT